MDYLITGKVIHASGRSATAILINGDRISGIIPQEYAPASKRVIRLDNYTLLPGLIDLHIHGANGHDTMDATNKAIHGISRYLAKNGVTSFLATTVTARKEKVLAAVENVAQRVARGVDGAQLLGSYIEGPYINDEYKGAHPQEYIRNLDIQEIEEIIQQGRGTVRVFALAPEKANSPEVVEYLVKKGVKVALGHSNATYGETIRAIDAGASIAVHAFNGMRGLHHREPGILGAVLSRDEIMAELIADGIHVDTAVMKILLRCKSKYGIVLVTDCMQAGGLTDGEYKLGELKVTVQDSIARIDSGSLAGSTLRLIDGVKNMVQKVGVPLADAVQMASLNPARAIGMDRELGSLEHGKRADIIAIDDDFNVVFTMVAGSIVYNALI